MEAESKGVREMYRGIEEQVKGSLGRLGVVVGRVEGEMAREIEARVVRRLEEELGEKLGQLESEG